MMRRFISLALATVALLAGTSAQAAVSPLFLCRVMTAEDYLSDPATAASERLAEAVELGASFTLDTLSGVIRWTFEREGLARVHFPLQTATYTASQRGTPSNDWVFVRRVEGLASNPLDVVRIRTWAGVPRFVWLDAQGRVFRGPCTER